MKLPLPLTEIVGSIADDLPESESQAFTAAVTTVAEGKDLSAAHWAFLAGELRAIRALLDLPDHIQALVDEVIAGIDRLAAGKEWPEAAKAGCICYDIAVDSTTEYASYVAAYAAKAATNANTKVNAANAANAAEAAAAYAAEAAGTYASYMDDYTGGYTDARRRQGDTLLEIIDSAS